MKWTDRAATVLWLAALAACGGEQAPEAPPAAPAADTAAATHGAHDMGGMQMGGGALDEVRAHLRTTEGAAGEQLRAGLPRHRQMVANALAQMNREMRDMNMAADQEWTATVDAIREDLRRLPEMEARELESFMPEHRARVDRLLDMHESMMREM